VDDGVNPAETLPRIKLNTNPFTYRAASAQNADAVGGLNPSDLMDLYVDEAGDTMSGQLVVDFPGGATPLPIVRVHNVNDGYAPTALGANTIGLWADAASDGDEPKFGLVGTTKGLGHGGSGVLGQGMGTGEYNIGLYGFVVPTATDNYSGYFFGGDLLVLVPATPGDSAVRLPSGSISARETGNEPGIAHTFHSSQVSVTQGNKIVVDSVKIVAPVGGFVVVRMNGWVTIDHVTGTRTVARFSLSRNTNADFDNMGLQSIEAAHPSTVLDDGYRTISCVLVDSVAAGTNTYYFVGELPVGASGSLANYTRTHLVATYYPTAYGSVVYPLPGYVGDPLPATTDGRDRIPRLGEVTREEHNARLEAEVSTLRSRIEALEGLLPAAAQTVIEAESDR